MLNISGQNIELTEAIKQRIESKFEKLNERFPVTTATVHISVSNKQVRCLADLSSPDYGNVSAEDTNKDFYVSANNVFEKLTRQLNDAKNRTISKGRESIRHQSAELEAEVE